mmetsp:Transcript_77301/g.94785  ORF Transcript_77301/g.94785 Transcript_77301/m.94785 type:complete len:303 (-) Transcript_77301:129-1037(-)
MGMSGNCACCLGFGFVLFIIFMSLFIASFVYVDYDEYAFKKNTLTNKINQEIVYENGRYFWGVNFAKVEFPKLYQKVVLELSVANQEGVSVFIDVSFWYKIFEDDLQKLYSNYGTRYESQITSISTAAIRNTAVDFSVNEYLKDRRFITESMANTLSSDLQNIMFIDVPPKWINLGDITFSQTLLQTHLNAAVALEANKQKDHEKDATEVRSNTKKEVESITANTTIITRTAQANKTSLIEKAQASYEKIIGDARGQGLTIVINKLGINNDDTKSKFLKLMAILDNNQTKIVDVSSVIIDAQ